MASKQNGGTKEQKVAVPDFKDVSKEEVAAAVAATASGRQAPLVVPSDAQVSGPDKKGTTYARWTQRAIIEQAYRGVSSSKLMDVVVVVKLRQGKDNNGRKVWSHFYMNQSENMKEGHEEMNERSIGSITGLLIATGFMPAGGALKGTLLNKMFPSKNQPGTASGLVGKTVMVNIVQTDGPAKDFKTGKPKLDEEGNPLKEKRDSGESFLPDAKSTTRDEEDGDEDAEGDEEE